VYSLVGKTFNIVSYICVQGGHTTSPSEIDMNKKEEFLLEIEEQFFNRVQCKQPSILFSVEKIEV
jgi:hypothetical protein